MTIFLFYGNNCNADENNIFFTEGNYFDNFKYEMQSIFDEYDNAILNKQPNFIEKIFNLIYKQENILIGVVGESASGKSTLIKEIQKSATRLDLPISFLNADNYYKDVSEIVRRTNKNVSTLIKESLLDLDCPEAFDLGLLKGDLFKLKNGTNIFSPKYSMDGTGSSIPNQIQVQSNNVIITEGIAVAYEEVSDVFDFKIYVDIDIDTRKERFINRSKERQIKEGDINEMWNRVATAGEKYIQPRKKDADIVVSGDINIDTMGLIISKFNNLISKYRKLIN